MRDSCGVGRREEGSGCGGRVGVGAAEEEGVPREGCVGGREEVIGNRLW